MVTLLRCHSGTKDNEPSKIKNFGPARVIPRRPTVLDLAIHEVSKDLICLICKGIYHEPVSVTPCGHIFCRKCIAGQMESRNHKCLQCNTLLLVGILHKSEFVQKQVNDVKLYCENGVSYDMLRKRFTVHGWHREGCRAVVTNANYEAHIHNCIFTLVACPFGVDGCPVVIERGGLEAHIPICEFRSEICKCGEKVFASWEAKHVLFCIANKIPCPHNSLGCKALVSRSHLVEHLMACLVKLAKSDIHLQMAEKVRKECLSEALKKMEILQINPKSHDPESQRLFCSLEGETVHLFESKTKTIPKYLRDAVKDKLLVQLSFGRINNKGASSSTTKSKLQLFGERTMFSPDQILEMTDGFAKSNLLGSGGFGSVYRGELYGTAVAVKKLHEGGNAEEFEFEVEVLHRIRHPHIVLLMGCCPENSCIVSEFLPGGSLDYRLKGSGSGYPPLTWVERLRVMCEVSSALLNMHKNNILHRDLKPANILLDGHNTAKLADMGLAKLFDISISASAVKGTPGYLDPHQLQTGRLSHATDVYAFGLIMLQLIVGQGRVQPVHDLLDTCPSSFGRRDLGQSADIFHKELDASAGEWGQEHARALIQLALRCVEREPMHRPDVEAELQLELSRILRAAKTGVWEPQKMVRVKLNPANLTPVGEKETSRNPLEDPQTYAGVHFHYACDQCGTYPICGYRYESFRRRDYNLCPSCVANQSQASGEFRAIPPPEDSNGAFFLSLGYPNGICTIQSEHQRVDLLWEASEAGNLAAICELGLAYQRGKGLPKDPSEALRQFTLASVRSYPYAQFLLGKAYLEGQGTSVDLKRARGLLESAANGGNADAQLELAECLLVGKGGPVNVPKGIKLMRIAAEGGHVRAQRRLGRCYAKGCGVPRDYEKARQWWSISNSK